MSMFVKVLGSAQYKDNNSCNFPPFMIQCLNTDTFMSEKFVGEGYSIFLIQYKEIN